MTMEQTASYLFQSTPPRGGRRERRVIVADLVGVSIHAPAWGATVVTAIDESNSDVSIHAPAWGATVYL